MQKIITKYVVCVLVVCLSLCLYLSNYFKLSVTNCFYKQSIQSLETEFITTLSH